MGSIFRQQYYVTLKNGTRVKRQSKKWYIQWQVGPGQYRRRPAYTNRKASEKMLERFENAVALRTEGLINEASKAAGKPIKLHVRDFIRSLRHKGDCKDHRRTTFTRIKRICRLGKIRYIGQITKGRVNKALAALADPKKWPRPISETTANGYRTAVKSFTAWLDDEHRLKPDPLSSLHKKTVDDADRVKFRRPLSPDEFGKLLEAAVRGRPFREIAGIDRAALYILAAFSGFRRRELSSVTPKSFAFGDSPTLTVDRAYTKRKKTDPIPLRRDLAELLHSYVRDKPSNAPLWPIGRINTAKMIQADLDAAGIAWQSGKIVVEFHSLRQNFATGLARAGVHPKLAQKLLRHSDVNLTMGVYTVMEDSEERQAVESMPVPGNLTHALTQQRARIGNARESNSTSKSKSRPSIAGPKANASNRRSSRAKAVKPRKTQGRKK
jgi:integrase/recombinase XerC